MTNAPNVERWISGWLEDQEAGTHYPDGLLSATFDEIRDLGQARPLRWNRRPMLRSWTSLAPAGAAAVVLVVAGVVGLNVIINEPGPAASPTPSPSASPTADLGIFAPAAGRIVIGSLDGIWAVDPADRSKPIKVAATTGGPLGWSRDGTRLLIQKADGNLSVLHADGSETRLTDRPAELQAGMGSGRPTGATISPDGSRVVFAGLTKAGHFCHDGALFSVDADGGPVAVFWTSHIPQNGIVKGPTFSPDGTQIAFVDGYCDNSNNVWVANADGSNAHRILTEDDRLINSPNDVFGYGLDGGHVQGLAWSPTGDRIALAYEKRAFTFAPDGSDIEQVAGGGGATGIYWSPDGTQVETTGPWLRGTAREPTAEPSPSAN